jgi:hypothetical protein
LQKVLKQCARLCIELKLIEGNTLLVDGSKVRANASINSSWTKQKSLKLLEKIDGRIAEILSECESVDQAVSQELLRHSLIVPDDRFD